MANPPFKHWYAIVNYGCWYLGIHITKEEAEEEAIRVFHVQLSKGGYCIVSREVLEVTFNAIKTRLEKDSK